jgi:hypothetical protein
VRLTVSLRRIERRLASYVTSGRRDDLQEAASSIAAAEGAGIEDVVGVQAVPRPVMSLTASSSSPNRCSTDSTPAATSWPASGTAECTATRTPAWCAAATSRSMAPVG